VFKLEQKVIEKRSGRETIGGPRKELNRNEIHFNYIGHIVEHGLHFHAVRLASGPSLSHRLASSKRLNDLCATHTTADGNGRPDDDRNYFPNRYRLEFEEGLDLRPAGCGSQARAPAATRPHESSARCAGCLAQTWFRLRHSAKFLSIRAIVSRQCQHCGISIRDSDTFFLAGKVSPIGFHKKIGYIGKATVTKLLEYRAPNPMWGLPYQDPDGNWHWINKSKDLFASFADTWATVVLWTQEDRDAIRAGRHKRAARLARVHNGLRLCDLRKKLAFRTHRLIW
jgi:hypothetical protein